MKRFLAIVLVLTIVLSLAACGTDSRVKEPASVSSENSQNAEKETPADNGSHAEAEEKPDPTEEEPTATTNLEATVEETVILDESNVKVTVKGLSMDGWSGPSLKLLIENNSDKALTFQTRNSSVNGYMVETIMSENVAAGKKSNTDLTFSSSELELAGITEIADMEFSLHVFDSDSWDDYLDSAQISVKTSLADSFDYQFDDSGEVVYNANGIKLVVKGLLEGDSYLGPEIVMYIENNSDQNFTVQVRDVSINGFMMTAVFSSDVMVGKRCIDGITFLSSDMEDNGVTKIDSAELSFHIFNMDSWDDIADTEPITITFE